MGMDGSKVWDAFQAGDIGGIRNYCETDVLNTCLVYLRFELIRGRLPSDGYDKACRQVRAGGDLSTRHLNSEWIPDCAVMTMWLYVLPSFCLCLLRLCG